MITHHSTLKIIIYHSINHHLLLKIPQLPKVVCLAHVSNFWYLKKIYFLWDPRINLVQLLLILLIIIFFLQPLIPKFTEPKLLLNPENSLASLTTKFSSFINKPKKGECWKEWDESLPQSLTQVVLWVSLHLGFVSQQHHQTKLIFDLRPPTRTPSWRNTQIGVLRS